MVSAQLLEWARTTLRVRKNAAHKDFTQLSQLTIVIPSFCRQDYLLRQIAYWGYSRATVIIVDGSPASIGSQLESLICDLPNITYMSLPDTYINRHREACRHIKTPYATCLADDDLFLMKGLCLAIDHLERNGDPVACIGQAVAVDFDHQKRRAYLFRYGDSLRKYQVIHADPVERVRSGMNAYRSATSNAVYRVPIFKEIWDTLQVTSCPDVIEYEHAIGTYILGSLSSVDHLFWIRSFECEAVSSPIDGSRKLDFSTWWTSQKYRHECAEFVNRQAKKLSIHSALSVDEARNVILEAVAFILGGESAGLMNENPFSSLVNVASKIIRSRPYLCAGLNKLWSTKIGIIIRDKIRATAGAAIRAAAVKPVASAESGILDHLASELEDILVLISGFYAAQRLQDKNSAEISRGCRQPGG